MTISLRAAAPQRGRDCVSWDPRPATMLSILPPLTMGANVSSQVSAKPGVDDILKPARPSGRDLALGARSRGVASYMFRRAPYFRRRPASFPADRQDIAATHAQKKKARRSFCVRYLVASHAAGDTSAPLVPHCGLLEQDARCSASGACSAKAPCGSSTHQHGRTRNVAAPARWRSLHSGRGARRWQYDAAHRSRSWCSLAPAPLRGRSAEEPLGCSRARRGYIEPLRQLRALEAFFGAGSGPHPVTPPARRLSAASSRLASPLPEHVARTCRRRRPYARRANVPSRHRGVRLRI